MAGLTMKALERRIGQRRDATRAPTQAPEWRGRLGRPKQNQTRRSLTYCGRKMVLTMGSTLEGYKEGPQYMLRMSIVVLYSILTAVIETARDDKVREAELHVIVGEICTPEADYTDHVREKQG